MPVERVAHGLFARRLLRPAYARSIELKKCISLRRADLAIFQVIAIEMNSSLRCAPSAATDTHVQPSPRTGETHGRAAQSARRISDCGALSSSAHLVSETIDVGIVQNREEFFAVDVDRRNCLLVEMERRKILHEFWTIRRFDVFDDEIEALDDKAPQSRNTTARFAPRGREFHLFAATLYVPYQWPHGAHAGCYSISDGDHLEDREVRRLQRSAFFNSMLRA